MSRNNEDRTGAHSIHSETPPQIVNQTTQSQDNLSFVVPTEFVELPSQGLFYSENHPLHKQDCVEIKFMTAKEEDILSDKALLKKGLAIDRFLRSVIVNRDIDVDSLLVGDKNAILVASRINGYGAEYDTKVICPLCFSHGRHEFNLDECQTNTIDQAVELGVEKTPNGTLLFNLPRTGAKVECKLITGKEEKSLAASNERRKKNKLPAEELTTLLRTIIVSVNGNDDRGYIGSFVENVPAADSRQLRTTYQKCIPNVELKEEYVCGECEASTIIDVPFTTDFFWPH